jgi:carbonic anhydrase
MKNVSWKNALNRLKTGNAHFVEDHLDGKLQNSSRRGDLIGGQNPYAIILSCADSRVVPELAFDTGLGELFVIRVAGNIANTSSIASIEYAVANLDVNLIVVMGHENCGAITAALNGGDYGYNLNHLIGHMTPALNVSKKKDVNSVVKVNAHLTSKQLLSRSHIIADVVEKGTLKVIPAYYNLGTGIVDFFVEK